MLQIDDALLEKAKLVREVVIAARFSLVGVIATGVHLLVVWVVMSPNSAHPLAANLIAFLAAFLFSFLGNYIWTFSSPGRPYRAMLRFVIISGSGLLANSLLLMLLLSLKTVSPLHSALFAAFLIPLFTFVMSRLWVFKTKA